MSTQTNTCAVTIAGPDRRVDVVVSTETPIRQLIPTFVELSVDEPPAGGRPAAGLGEIAPPGRQPLRAGQHARRERDRRRRRPLADAAAVGGAGAAAPREVHRERAEPGRGTPRGAHLPRAPGAAALGRPRVARDEGVLRLRADEPLLESAEPPRPVRAARADEARGALRARARAPTRGASRTTSAGSTADRAAELNRCATVAIVSPKGGVGKTTLTALLGSLLAPHRQRPHRGRRHEPRLRLARPQAHARPRRLRRRPRRRARSPRPQRHRARPSTSAARSRA